MTAGAVLFVDDEPQNVELFRLQFESDFEDIITASSGEEALAILSSADSRVSVVLTDERMPGMRGVDLLAQAARRWPDVVRVIVSAYGDAPRLLAAINFGHAHEYVLKPWDKKELGECIARTLTIATRRRSLETAAARATHVEADAAAAYGLIVGEQGDLAPILAIAKRAASSSVPVLITGEVGTGKELVARFIHAQSGRTGAFLRLDCRHVAVEKSDELFGPKGRLEAAQSGTLFLDEISALPLSIQAQIARAIDDGSTTTTAPRLIGATQAAPATPLDPALKYHFNAVVIPLPALRDRKSDLAQLAQHFAEKHTRLGDRPHRIDDDALTALAAYAWPGNVRELESIVARAVALADGQDGAPLTVDDFTFRLDIPVAPTPTAIAAPASLSPKEEARAHEATDLRALLLAHGGNLASAARATNVPRTTLLSRAKKLGLL